ncbi:hypothetical protein CRYUN_Cryun30bG0047700 [Craigia yunnanensis]
MADLSLPHDSLFLGFDSSTQSLKATVLDSNLVIVASELFHFDSDLPHYKTKDGVYRDPSVNGRIVSPTLMWVEALDLILQRLFKSNLDFGKIAAVSGAYACIDETDGAGMNLMDVKQRAWSKVALEAYVVTSVKLQSGDSLKLINIFSGLTLNTPGDLAISLGTSDTVHFTTLASSHCLAYHANELDSAHACCRSLGSLRILIEGFLRSCIEGCSWLAVQQKRQFCANLIYVQGLGQDIPDLQALNGCRRPESGFQVCLIDEEEN